MSSANNIGVIILAAGSSSRLGEPKQLLRFGGESLLQHAVDAATNSNANTVIEVLGANAESVLAGTDQTTIHTIINPDWEEGMASSVRVGLNELLFMCPETDAVILMVCDQPFISSSVLNDLISTHVSTGNPIVACNYGEAFGPPALFHRSLFDELMNLKGDVGARKIIQQHKDQVTTVLFPKGKIDIDTNEDYEALKNF
jgi:molybdenum cofactor cytidylyltransferase